jgi:hypothetical protein
VAEHLELALMVEAGLTPMQAITNAPSNAAALLKLDDRSEFPVRTECHTKSKIVCAKLYDCKNGDHGRRSRQ